ncbi:MULTISPECIES: molecular chaperone HtpG [Vitreoscilla]|uniref:Chaperone protein HtpG n=1 Tax=Vitreoscilla stercoraria TaxID=61 RepID=A0ABY4ED02_VITST|nr:MULTISPECIES: molecular chaperone HtpG [Vitreoscilla]QJQ52377.1 chaperone protein HtpG [Vitreoscilla sp. C1]UOO92805.1 molecular chaperone HtpG [Vitreoscilla stercoraria]
MKETLSFQTEVKQLLQLMIHSLYSNKEIFLRELISNAADATDKLRFESLNQAALLENDGDLKITVTCDVEAKTITVSDNGIGMSREEVIENLGTIAKSGTKAFFEQLSGDAKKDANLIGQFGVGFYSAFIVADEVTVETRRAGAAAHEAVRWVSRGDGEFSIEAIEKTERGTSITLHVKEAEAELLSDWTLRRIVTTYSDHISVPILMKQAPQYDDEGNIIHAEELEAVNQAQALWTRSKNDISDEQYQEFYKHISHDFQDALAWSHFRVEGKHEYTGLMYVPKAAPYDLYEREAKGGVKLYVKRVFIMDDVQKLMPMYLRFIKGVIDTSDLPLNVSREILQQSRDLDQIRAGAVKKILAMLEDLAKNRAEDYTTFWNTFGSVFKEGIGEDAANKNKLAGLCRFASTAGGDATQNVSLADYIERMKEGQDKIYYITAETYAAAKNSPHLEIYLKKGIEVLLLTDRVDEWVVGSLFEFEGKKLASVSKGELDLGDLANEADKAEQEKAQEAAKDVVATIKTHLGDKVADVRATTRLTESPACLVVGEFDMSQNLQRMLAQAGAADQMPSAKPTLEINAEHVLVQRLANEGNGVIQAELSQLLYDQALLAEGGKLEDPASFVKRMNQLLVAAHAS